MTDIVTLTSDMGGWFTPVDETEPELRLAHFFRSGKRVKVAGSACRVIQFLGADIRAMPYRGEKSPLDPSALDVCSVCRSILLHERAEEKRKQAEREEHERMLNSTKETA